MREILTRYQSEFVFFYYNEIMCKKIKKSDLPRSNFQPANIMYSLSKAIYHGKEGDFNDCGFEFETDFINFLDALVKANLIGLKTNPYSKTYNLANYIYIGNDYLKFDKKNSFLLWLKNNAVDLIVAIATCYNLFSK